MKKNLNEEYWDLVIRSLVEIFDFTPATARKKMHAFRSEIETICKSKRLPNLIYNENPARIASEIAGKKFLKRHLNQFFKFYDELYPESVAKPRSKVIKLSEKRTTSAAKSGAQAKIKRAK